VRDKQITPPAEPDPNGVSKSDRQPNGGTERWIVMCHAAA